MTVLTINLNAVTSLTHEKFSQLCFTNPDLKLERTAEGELVVMPPTKGDTGRYNSELNGQLRLWNRQFKLGECFDSSTGFILPNGATRSPDASWVKKYRWDALTPEQQSKFVPLCPDFVIELVSSSDIVQQTRKKMEEYRENGCSLGWLINRCDRQVEIYRSEQRAIAINAPLMISGEDILPSFELDLSMIW